jgi:hypothetical protein
MRRRIAIVTYRADHFCFALIVRCRLSAEDRQFPCRPVPAHLRFYNVCKIIFALFLRFVLFWFRVEVKARRAH